MVNHSTAIARKQGFPDVIMPGKLLSNSFETLISTYLLYTSLVPSCTKTIKLFQKIESPKEPNVKLLIDSFPVFVFRMFVTYFFCIFQFLQVTFEMTCI